MASLEKWLFGYVIFRIDPSDIKKCANLLLNASVSTDIHPDGTFPISLFHVRSVKKIMTDKIVFSVSDPMGLPGAIYRTRKCYGVYLGVLLSLLLAVFMSLFVLDVRIEGNESVDGVLIESELAEVGLYGGAIWAKIDRSEIETRLLESSPNIGWVNINRRGLVAYVTVREKEVYELSEESISYANIVSGADAVIEEVMLTRGTALVKPGDTVHAGELLISGVTENGELLSAEGEILARVNGTLRIFVPRTEIKKKEEEPVLLSRSMNFFGFSINLLKKYSNLPDDCVIIEDKRNCYLFGKYRLPITIYSSYGHLQTSESVTYDNQELIAIAEQRHKSALRLYLEGADLIRISTTGYFTEDGYVLESEVIRLCQIGKSVPFIAE